MIRNIFDVDVEDITSGSEAEILRVKVA